MKKWRKSVSLTALVSFALLLLTSVILYIVPAGRVAYWADWRLWGLTKTQWINVHVNLGVLFLLAIGLHTYLNWNPMVSYLKTKAKSLRVFTTDFNVALVVTIVVIAGTLWMVPPFSSIIHLGDAIKDKAAVAYGEPPYGHAELSSMETFVKRMGWNPAEVRQRLAASGIQLADMQVTIQQIATTHGMTPQKVYTIMQPPEKNLSSGTLPDTPIPGTGRRTLADICQAYNLNIPSVLRQLEAQNIKASAEMTIKTIAEAHNMSATDFYYALKKITDGMPH
jgi:hypothetical protein